MNSTALPNKAALRNILLRLVAGAVLTGSLVAIGGTWAAQAYLPILRWTFTQLASDYRVVELSVSEQGIKSNSDRYFKLDAAPVRSVFVGTQLVPANPDGRAHLRILIAFLWQPFMVALPLALAWPATGLREWVVRLSSLGSILMALTFIDVPVLFWSSIWEFYLQMFAPSQFSLLVAWGQLLQGGGQLLLGKRVIRRYSGQHWTWSHKQFRGKNRWQFCNWSSRECRGYSVHELC